MKKHIRGYHAFAPLLVIIIFLALVAVVLGYAKFKAESLGNHLGESTGNAVGTAIGTWKGITEKKQEGAQAGKADALKNVEVVVNGNDIDDVFGAVQSTGRLVVLEAGVQLENFQTLGDSYKNLELIAGKAVFSVDLSSASKEVSNNGTKLTIWIPEPEMELSIDENGTKQIAEWKGSSWTTSAGDEIVAHINSRAAIMGEAEKYIRNYDTLLNYAEDYAKEQVKQLAENASLEKREIVVNISSVESKRGE